MKKIILFITTFFLILTASFGQWDWAQNLTGLFQDYAIFKVFSSGDPGTAKTGTARVFFNSDGDPVYIDDTGEIKSMGGGVSPWRALKAYKENDAILNITDGQIYKAKADFTSAASFDLDSWELVSETQSDKDFLINRSFEKSTVASPALGWTLTTGTGAVETTEKLLPGNQSLSVTLSSQEMDLEQSVICEKYGPNEVGFYGWIKSSSEVEVCSYSDSTEIECATYDGSDNWKPVLVSIQPKTGEACKLKIKTESVSDVVYLDKWEFTKKPYTYKNLRDFQASSVQQSATFGNADITGTLTTSSGGGLYSYDSGTGVYTALRDIELHAAVTFRSNGAVVQPLILVNGSQELAAATGAASVGDRANAAGFDHLSAGDTWKVRNAVVGSTNEQYIYMMAYATSEYVITPMEAGSQIIRYDGYNGLSTNFVKLTTRQYNLDADGNDNSFLFEDDNTTYTKITALKPSYFDVSIGASKSSAITISARRYNSLDVLQESSTDEQNTAFNTPTVSINFRMDIGDYVVFYSNNAGLVNSVENTWFTVKATPLRANFKVAIPIQRTAYLSYDTDASRHTVLTTVTTVPLDVERGSLPVGLASNQFTLPKGDYDMNISAMLYQAASATDIVVIYLYDVTNSANVIESISNANRGDASGQQLGKMIADFPLNLSEPTTFEMRTFKVGTSGAMYIGDTYTGDTAKKKATVKITKIK